MWDHWWLASVQPTSQHTRKYLLLTSRIFIFTYFLFTHITHAILGMRVTPAKGDERNISWLIDIPTGWYSILDDAQCTSTYVVVTTCMEMWSCSQEMCWALKRPRGTLGARHDESFMPRDDVNHDTSPLWRGTPGLQLAKVIRIGSQKPPPERWRTPPPKCFIIFLLARIPKM